MVNDVVGAWATATGAAPGLAVISGPAAMSSVSASDGSCWRAGGWGHVLGDEGSGYWIGVRSRWPRSCTTAMRPGRVRRSATRRCEFFEVGGVQELIALVYGKPLDKSEIAALGAQTAKLARGGDDVAVAYTARPPEELARRSER